MSEEQQNLFVHEPVLLQETLELLAVQPSGRYIDGTMGSGGHSTAILEKLDETGQLLGIDRDAGALERCGVRLSSWIESGRMHMHRANFCELADAARELGWNEVDGVLLDLGFSSDQIEAPERGFSFMKDGPLDMRMDQRQEVNAAWIVNRWAEADLKNLLRTYGEEPSARRIAAAICRERVNGAIETTGRLAEVIETECGRRGRLHPATKTFQALRIEVNDELGSAERALHEAIGLLKEGGRLAVITFHSLEDRLVKRTFREHEGKSESLQQGGSRWRGTEPRVRRVNRKVVSATEEEARTNPRARSAKLRVVERWENE